MSEESLLDKKIEVLEKINLEVILNSRATPVHRDGGHA